MKNQSHKHATTVYDVGRMDLIAIVVTSCSFYFLRVLKKYLKITSCDMYSFPYAVEMCKVCPISRKRVHAHLLSHTNFRQNTVKIEKVKYSKRRDAWIKLVFATSEASVCKQFDIVFDYMVLDAGFLFNT